MRNDIDELNSPELCQAIKAKRYSVKSEPLDSESLISRDRAGRVQTRRQLIESNERDPNGFERVLGVSNLCSINFLTRGFEAARSVARLRVRRPQGGSEWHGTGFLVAPGLLLTNHHVLPNPDAAALAIAEFDYEHDLNGVERSKQVFNLMPQALFFADSGADFALVQLAPRSFAGMPLSEYGFLPLIPQSGKGLDREWVSIVQHPGGQPKQIAIRNSQIVVLDEEDAVNIDLERFIHYTTDTEPGSSGAPVFNDQWQVVALHHRGVPDYNERGERLARDGKTVWTEEMGDDERGWVANQGVRVSAIYDVLSRERLRFGSAGKAFRKLTFGLATGRRPVLSVVESPASGAEFEAQGADSPPELFAGIDGYEPAFLSEDIPLPQDNTRDEHQAKLEDGTTELKYTHFSIVFDSDRRFARIAAVNIDGQQLRRNSGVKKIWRRDSRIDVNVQPDDDFYKKSIATEPVFFQRGHLVRRVDPSWGTEEESIRAIHDTFHFTNAAPHQATFNNSIWGDLEDYLLVKCDETMKRMTVFSGPVFSPSDPTNYGINRPGGPYTVPLKYWKVGVIQKTSDTIAAAGFMVSHGHHFDPFHEDELVFAGLNPYTPTELAENEIQTTIASIEMETGLSFGDLKNFDSVAGLESTQHTRRLRSVEDIII